MDDVVRITDAPELLGIAQVQRGNQVGSIGGSHRVDLRDHESVRVGWKASTQVDHHGAVSLGKRGGWQPVVPAGGREPLRLKVKAHRMAPMPSTPSAALPLAAASCSLWR